jgi:hypothetical protein
LVRLSLVRLILVRLSLVRLSLVRLSLVRLSLVRLSLVRLSLVRLSLVRLSLVRLSLVRLSLVRFHSQIKLTHFASCSGSVVVNGAAVEALVMIVGTAFVVGVPKKLQLQNSFVGEVIMQTLVLAKLALV